MKLYTDIIIVYSCIFSFFFLAYRFCISHSQITSTDQRYTDSTSKLSLSSIQQHASGRYGDRAFPIQSHWALAKTKPIYGAIRETGLQKLWIECHSAPHPNDTVLHASYTSLTILHISSGYWERRRRRRLWETASSHKHYFRSLAHGTDNFAATPTRTTPTTDMQLHYNTARSRGGRRGGGRRGRVGRGRRLPFLAHLLQHYTYEDWWRGRGWRI